MIRSLLFYIALVLVTVPCGIGAACFGLIHRSGNTSHRIARFWARSLLCVSGVKVKVEGLHHINPSEAYVFAANHQSQFDIFTLLGHLPIQFRWLAKSELFRIPVFGAGMRGAGYIPIDRSDRRKAFKSIDLAAQQVREGISIVIFPEGTRSLDGKLQSFKKGGFHLAIKSGRPIIPVSIIGAFSILPKKGFKIRPRTVQVYIGKPIPTENVTVRDRDRLISEVRRKIQDKLPSEERGEPEPVTAQSPTMDSTVS